ncbi:thioesterase domain-containing protein [Kutzneria buriramensis]|uniref:thioesterase domain-containing protein n=1 Tax=Kutzneria buriramensis TaxID=1045776 RepID=UPI0035EEAEEE
MARDYVEQIRTVQPDGPYHLLGWSFGGLLAQHMVVLLQRQSHKVGDRGHSGQPPAAQPLRQHG